LDVVGKAAKMHRTIAEYAKTAVAQCLVQRDNEDESDVTLQSRQCVDLAASTAAFFVAHVACLCSEGTCPRRPFQYLVIHPTLLPVFPRALAVGHLKEKQVQCFKTMTESDQQIFAQWVQHNSLEANKQRSHLRITAAHAGAGTVPPATVITPVKPKSSETPPKAVESKRKRPDVDVDGNCLRAEDETVTRVVKMQRCDDHDVTAAASRTPAVPHVHSSSHQPKSAGGLVPRPWTERERYLIEQLVSATGRMSVASFDFPSMTTLDGPLALPMLIECKFNHSLYGPIHVSALLAYMERSEPDGTQIRGGQYEHFIPHDKFARPFRALCLHRICSIAPSGTPLDCLISEWFSSFHASARHFGHYADGWKAWTVYRYPALTLARVMETVGFQPHPDLLVDEQVSSNQREADPETGLDVAIKLPCPMRDVLAVFCRIECDEVRCKPQEHDHATSATYYECCHGVEYVRDHSIRMNADHRDAVDAIHTGARSHKNDSKFSRTVVGETASELSWRKRIRFLTVEQAMVWVECIERTSDTVSKKVATLLCKSSPEHRNLWQLVMAQTILRTPEDLDRMLQYWSPRVRPSEVRTGPGTPVMWDLKHEHLLLHCKKYRKHNPGYLSVEGNPKRTQFAKIANRLQPHLFPLLQQRMAAPHRR